MSQWDAQPDGFIRCYPLYPCWLISKSHRGAGLNYAIGISHRKQPFPQGVKKERNLNWRHNRSYWQRTSFLLLLSN